MQSLGIFRHKKHLEKGKHTPRAKEKIYVGFDNNLSAWAFWIPEDKKIMSSNQIKFSKHEFPFRIKKMVD